MEEIKVALLGVGGYASHYLHTLEHPLRDSGIRLVGAVDPYCKKCNACPVYDTAEKLYAHHQPDVVIICTPIHYHVEQAVQAFEHGCHVMLEKPIAADMAGVKKILDARDKAGKMLSIGFQLCADEAMQEVKKDVDAGLFGKPKSLKSLVLWPRSKQYYFGQHSSWGGKRYSRDGRPIFDNVLSNATAHYLMNILFMLGEPLEEIQCATYRAYDIETFDTAVVKGRTASGAQAFIAVSHVAGPDIEQNPLFSYEFENATLEYGFRGHKKRGDCFRARFKDGTVKEYSLIGQGELNSFWNLIAALRGEEPIMCTGETASMHVAAMEKMRSLQPDACEFPREWIREKDEYLYVPGLADAMYKCFDTCTLPDWDLTADELKG